MKRPNVTCLVLVGQIILLPLFFLIYNITPNTLNLAHALNEASVTKPFQRRVRRRNTLLVQDITHGKGKGSSSSKGKGSSSSYWKGSKSPKCSKSYKSSSSNSRHDKYSSISKGGKSKGSSNNVDCIEDPTPSPSVSTSTNPSQSPTTHSPTILLTTKQTIAPTSVPTQSPTRLCSSVQGRQEDIDAIASAVVGSSILPGTPEGDALNWILNVDTVNSCDDGGIALLERFVLALFFYQTGGENWLNSNRWLSLASHCTWAGIECGTDGRVDTISLNQNNLSGGIPGALSNLANLSALKLFENALEGTVPTSLYQLPKLSFLDIEANNLSGKMTIDGLLIMDMTFT